MSISAFLKRCDDYRAKRSISDARLSTLLFNDGKKIDALRSGRDIGVLTLERALVGLMKLEDATSATPEPDATVEVAVG